MRFCLLLFCLSGLASLTAQDQYEPAGAVRNLFAKMAAGDSSGVRTMFRPDATLHSVVAQPDGTTIVATGDLTAWLRSIAGAGPGTLTERGHYAEVRIDGQLATVWMPYVFYLNGTVRHCGTNAFQLVQDGPDAPWRILHVTDTRRAGSDGCTTVNESPAAVRIDSLLTRWHRAAARADSAAFFDALANDAVYIGTDKTEHWTKAEFLGFAAPYFARGKAWSFRATERHVFYDPDANVAHADELLDTWMGPCRGTAVLRRRGDNDWEIVHYTLSVTVDNDKIEAFKKL